MEKSQHLVGLRVVRRVLVAAVVSVLAVAAVSSASATTPGAVRDQSVAATLCNTPIGSLTVGQTFTAGRTGLLTDLVLTVVNVNATSPLHVEIRDTDSFGYRAGTTVLATADIPASAGGGTQDTFAWDVNFASPAFVTAGTKYSIMVSYSGTGFWRWMCDLHNPYAGGNESFRTSNSTWQLNGAFDMAFDSYVLTPVLGTTHTGYCSAPGNTLPTGTSIAPGTFLDLVVGQPMVDANYRGATPAIFLQGKGITCDPPPAGWTQHGYADALGASPDPDAPYLFYTPE